MLHKIIAGFLIFATTMLFGMSLSALNSASKEELMQIHGIGEVKAAAILKERRKGKFKSFEDLTRVEGVGAHIVANIQNGVKSAADIKQIGKKAKKKTRKTASKGKKTTKEKTLKQTKKRKIKSMDEKKKALKSKTKKTRAKKSKTKKTKSKKKH